jgi:hypothetical protein
MIFLAMLAVVDPAMAARKAVVVGINDYKSLPRLQTAHKDAESVGKMLSDLGFSVTQLRDTDLASFNKAWKQFVDSVGTDDVVAFYFAGHGLQVEAINYRLMRDTAGPTATDAAVLKSSLNFHDVMEAVESKQPAASLYILDACRDNPFGKSKLVRLGETHGLAKVESVFGAFVMYSAGPDEAALDSLPGDPKGSNSLYTRYLLTFIRDTDAKMVDVAKKVQVSVEEAARTKVSHRQRPAYFDGILGNLYFADKTNPFRGDRPGDLAKNENIIRLSSHGQWGNDCENMSPPRASKSWFLHSTAASSCASRPGPPGWASWTRSVTG